MDAFLSKTFMALVFSFVCLCVKVYSRCDKNNPPTLKRVTFDMVAGRWFTQSGIKEFPNDGIPDGQFMSVFNLDFLPLGKLVYNGRTAYEPRKCLYNIIDTRSNRRIQSSFSGFVSYLNKDVELRILDTDFESYILVWKCYRFDPYNPSRCTDWAVDLITKTVDGNLSKKALWQIEIGLKRTICRGDLQTRIPDPKRICKRLSKSYGIGYGRRNYYW